MHPTLFLSHGGGPWPWVDGLRELHADMEAHLRSLLGTLSERPKAIVVVSAHWEERHPTVQTGAFPGLLYDYYGFPEHTYHLSWPAHGNPDLAREVAMLLEAAGFRVGVDAERGYDHGTFVPLSVAIPEADIPTLQLSLIKGFDPEQHLAMGRALAPLRTQGVLIVGSGMSYHDLGRLRPGKRRTIRESLLFDQWLQECVQRSQGEREEALAHWAEAPAARASHPREEHLMPLHVVAGAAGDDRAELLFNGTLLGAKISALRFG